MAQKFLTDDYGLFLIEARSTSKHFFSTLEDLTNTAINIQNNFLGLSNVRMYDPATAKFKRVAKKQILDWLTNEDKQMLQSTVMYFKKL
jgi:hypothetical protein